MPHLTFRKPLYLYKKYSLPINNWNTLLPENTQSIIFFGIQLDKTHQKMVGRYLLKPILQFPKWETLSNDYKIVIINNILTSYIKKGKNNLNVILPHFCGISVIIDDTIMRFLE